MARSIATLFLILFTVGISRDSAQAPQNEIRLPASLALSRLSGTETAGLIETSEDGRLISFRDKAVLLDLDPRIIEAVEIIKEAPKIAAAETDKTPSSSALSPLLAQDGATSPKLLASLPYAESEALDITGAPLRWRVPQNILAGYSLPRPFAPVEEDPPSPPPLRIKPSLGAAYYRQLVENFAARYNLSPALVMAIIHSESDFSPRLVSQKSAMGLMQLLPSTASDEVHRFLYGKRGAVSFEELAAPETNIRYGTAYLHILLTRYFSGVKNRDAREICAIAAYNLGPNRFIRLYGSSPEAAAEKINSMGLDEFYADLPTRLPTRETRFYVEKVRRMKNHYAASP